MKPFIVNKENPWLHIVKGENVAECDINAFPENMTPMQYANHISGGNKEIDLTFSCLPDPFCGNPRSKVYCLNMNPGKPDPCFSNEEVFQNATIKNLRLEQSTCFWAESIRNKCGKIHDGVEWMRKRTKRIKDYLGCNPDIFFIEYFPYHSSKGFAFPEYMPSYDFSDALIKQAMEEKKLIIIMREKTNWIRRLKKSIPDIEQYKNLYKLKCPQGGYLTKDNIVRYCDDTNNPKLSDEEIKFYFKINYNTK